MAVTLLKHDLLCLVRTLMTTFQRHVQVDGLGAIFLVLALGRPPCATHPLPLLSASLPCGAPGRFPSPTVTVKTCGTPRDQQYPAVPDKHYGWQKPPAEIHVTGDSAKATSKRAFSSAFRLFRLTKFPQNPCPTIHTAAVASPLRATMVHFPMSHESRT